MTFSRFSPPWSKKARSVLAASTVGSATAPITAQLDAYAAHHHRHLVEPVGFLFVPVFFVYAGMQVDLASFA